MSTKQRTISAKAFYEKLQSLDACKEALQFVKGKTFRQAYDQCNSPEWMLWLLGRSWIDKKVIQLIAVEFAETCASNAKDYPEVSECITVTKRYLDGKATRQKLGVAESAARSAAWSAAESVAASVAASAARSAAWSAERSAESAAWSAESAARSAAASAARSAAWSAERSAESAARSAAESAARSAAWSAERSAEMLNQCNIIRKHVPYDLIATLLFPERTVTA